MYGIVNGTCNYILSSMSSKDEAFAAALAKAQKRGYAEADPTLDISGGDSAHKLAILASIAFGYEIALEDIFVEGIDGIAREDIRYGREMGYCLKLLAIGQRNAQGKISLAGPSVVHRGRFLAGPGGRLVQRDQRLRQRGGRDLLLWARGRHDAHGQRRGRRPYRRGPGQFPDDLREPAAEAASEVKPLMEKIDDSVSRFYIRVMAKDKPGVVARYGKILGDHQISISGRPPARRDAARQHGARGHHDAQDAGKEHGGGPGGADAAGRHQRQARVHPDRGYSAG